MGGMANSYLTLSFTFQDKAQKLIGSALLPLSNCFFSKGIHDLYLDHSRFQDTCTYS